MRILVCADEAPLEPTTSGFRRAVGGLVEELARTHEVRVLGFRKPDQRSAVVPEHVRVVDWPTSGPSAKARLLTSAVLANRPIRTTELPALLARPLVEELERFDPDVVQVTPARLAGLRRILDPGRPRVLMAMDAWHVNVLAKVRTAGLPRSLFLRSEARRIRRFAATAYRGYDHVVMSSRDDGEAIRELDPTLSYTVIPIGVDARAWAASPDPAATPSARIVFHGVMSYPPNIEAAVYLATRVFPLVRAERPDATLAIVGRDPDPSVRRLSDLPSVDVTGAVPEIGPWLQGSGAWVGPFVSATGIKTKVLEAMACSVPCVVTPLGKRGLEMRTGDEVIVAEDERGIARSVLELLASPERARGIAHAARMRVLETYDWPAVRRAYERVYDDAIQARRSRFPAAR